MSAPATRVVFVQGICKVANLVSLMEEKDKGAERATCLTLSKVLRLGTTSSPSLQHDQKATQAIAHTAASKELVRSRPLLKAYMCSTVTGGRLRRFDVAGTNLRTPFLVCSSIGPACHGAPFTMCQKRRPESQVFNVEVATRPAASAAKAVSRISEAFSLSFTTILTILFICVFYHDEYHPR